MQAQKLDDKGRSLVSIMLELGLGLRQAGGGEGGTVPFSCQATENSTDLFEPSLQLIRTLVTPDVVNGH